MLDAGVIDRATTAHASQVLHIPKKDGSWRFCVDFCKLNAVTETDFWPLTLRDTCLRAFGGKSWFSRFAMVAGYWQLSVHSDDRPKSAFVVFFGQFQFRVMPLGLKNAPSIFARAIWLAFKDYVVDFLVTYLDDLNVASEDFEYHLRHLRLFLARCDAWNLRIRWRKCQIAQNSLVFFGFLISQAGVSPNPA